MSATSGKDTLGITRGGKENTFVIHFSDSAMVIRAVSRGYITVNGVDIELSDEVKKQLTDVNRQAQADSEKVYSEYIMQHELAVAKQQGGIKNTNKESENISDETAQGVSWSDFEHSGSFCNAFGGYAG